MSIVAQVQSETHDVAARGVDGIEMDGAHVVRRELLLACKSLAQPPGANRIAARAGHGAQRNGIPRFDRTMVAAVEIAGRRIHHAGQQVDGQDLLPVLLGRVPGQRRGRWSDRVASGSGSPRRRGSRCSRRGRRRPCSRWGNRQPPSAGVELAGVAGSHHGDRSLNRFPIGFADRDAFQRHFAFAGLRETERRRDRAEVRFAHHVLDRFAVLSRGSSHGGPSSAATGRRNGTDRAAPDRCRAGRGRLDPRRAR